MNQPLSSASSRFGRRVRDARVMLGLSQENIAELAQMHVTNYGKIERGRANPSLITILRIASVLGQEVSVLTEGLGMGDLPSDYELVTAQEFLTERNRHR